MQGVVVQTGILLISAENIGKKISLFFRCKQLGLYQQRPSKKAVGGGIGSAGREYNVFVPVGKDSEGLLHQVGRFHHAVGVPAPTPSNRELMFLQSSSESPFRRRAERILNQIN